ncbi:hypothetical protein [Sphingobium bisphenolivorans]|uniref:hypothetical protein n=1 Tax=Sphingobium bisphenolivorans TaxID=1335760 RepID=UPI0003A54EF5|nr:hypothetical protein [Sphingobium bisphenolivorans]
MALRNIVTLGLALMAASSATALQAKGLLSSLPAIATVDERFQSYNVEMVELTGGRFWAPYGSSAANMYRMRPPIDLNDPKLRNLTRQLAPAYMRVSGTWANNTYVQGRGENGTVLPKGFKQVLTRKQWQDAVAFSNAVDAPIVASFGVSLGTRGPDGAWRTDQAQRLVDSTREFGGRIAAAEFFNEPNMPSAAADLPEKYTAADYGADFRTFRDWIRKAAPGTMILGTGGVTEDRPPNQIPVPAKGAPIRSEDMLAANPGSLDAVSYHFYGIVSQRCASMGIGSAVKEDALTARWLDLTLRAYSFYAALRDKYEPGKPIWLTETAQASCGGSPWASTFLDSFRYLNQLGLLAQKGVRVVMHNTLAASDYALIDGDTLEPRPNYWAAVLWRRLMGTIVLGPPSPTSPDMRLYAHCLRGSSGGVALLALNTGDAPQKLATGPDTKAWIMTGQPLDSTTIRVNGEVPRISSNGMISQLSGRVVRGEVQIPAKSLAFLAVSGANNPACVRP